jgi:ribosomal protein L11 methyltransferase
VRDDGGGAAILPDGVTRGEVLQALGVPDVTVSVATGRDADSVWVLSPRVVRLGRLRLVPSAAGDPPPRDGDIRLIDTPAFGTGLHPTTALCIAVIDDIVQAAPVASMLDVGTGTGVLALAALALGVPRVVAFDIDGDAARAAVGNARLNRVSSRLQVLHAGLDAVAGRWPLVVANVLAAPLIEMAPVLATRLGHGGQLVLSGVSSGLQAEVERAYRRVGLHQIEARTQAGWVALSFRASW